MVKTRAGCCKITRTRIISGSIRWPLVLMFHPKPNIFIRSDSYGTDIISDTMKKNSNKTILPKDKDELIQKLSRRFEKNRQRHEGIEWKRVMEKLDAHPEKWRSLQAMEETGGEPDVIQYNNPTDIILFYDCSAESPAGRRSLCYDGEALESRKENKPADSAMEMAADMGIDLLSEEQYRSLQEFGPFDRKTSSWILTPSRIRELGGALFADYRYDTVFIYHNGASSYYAARGFRGCLKV